MILLLSQPSNFSPPANLSSANVGVSVFELTDYISVCFTSFSPSMRVFTCPLRPAILDPLLRCVVIQSKRRSRLFIYVFRSFRACTSTLRWALRPSPHRRPRQSSARRSSPSLLREPRQAAARTPPRRAPLLPMAQARLGMDTRSSRSQSRSACSSLRTCACELEEPPALLIRQLVSRLEVRLVCMNKLASYY